MTALYACRMEETALSLAECRKVHSLLARCLLAYAAEREYGLLADAFTEKRSAEGKPYWEGAPFHFNLSHSGAYILCALSDAPIGVDVERLRPIAPRVQRRFLGREFSDVSEQVTAWTRYESYGKMRGFGIPYPCVPSSGCYFRTYRDLDGYLLTLCSEREDFPDGIHLVPLAELKYEIN